MLNLHRILLLSLLFFVSCDRPTSSSKNDPFQLYVKKVQSKFIKQEQTLKRLPYIGTGLAVPDDKILFFSFIFLIEENVSVEKARVLIVDLIKDCRELIANKPDSSKFLIRSPDSIKNAQIDILIRRTDGREDTYLTYVSNWDDKIFYSKNGPYTTFEDFYNETFEEAEQTKISVEATNAAKPT